MDIKEIRNMGLGTSERPTWRLRSLTEEEELNAQTSMEDGAQLLQYAFEQLEKGLREESVAALRQVVKAAEKAIESIDK